MSREGDLPNVTERRPLREREEKGGYVPPKLPVPPPQETKPQPQSDPEKRR